MTAPWGAVDLVEGKETTLRFGSLSLTVLREGSELRTRRTLAGETYSAADPALLADPDGWKRWVFSNGKASLTLSPELPRRSIVVAPRDQFHLMRGVETTVFIGLPLWVRLRSGGTGEGMTELPTRSLTRTWFGSRAAGEVCYWHRSRFFLAPPPRQETAASVICALRIKNDSDEDLSLEKIALRMRHFSLFTAGGRHWTDEARIRFKGRDAGSQITYSGKPPDAAGASSRIREPHEPAGRVFWAKAFFNLFSTGNEL